MTFQLLVHVAFVINCVVAGFTWAMYYAVAPIVDAMHALTAADDVRAEEEMHAALLLNFVGLRGACDKTAAPRAWRVGTRRVRSAWATLRSRSAARLPSTRAHTSSTTRATAPRATRSYQDAPRAAPCPPRWPSSPSCPHPRDSQKKKTGAVYFIRCSRRPRPSWRSG